MAYSRNQDSPYGYHDEGNAYELPSRGGGYVMAGDADDQDDVPIHSRRQSRLGLAAPAGNARYSSYNDGGYSQAEIQGYYGTSSDAPPAQATRESSYGGYTDSPHLQEKYNNPFEQPAPQQDFDVMADFNNAGPRYSHLYGTAKDESMRELVKSGGRPITYVPNPSDATGGADTDDIPSSSYRPQTAHSELSKPYRPSPNDPEIEGESAIERSYSTRHSTRDGKRKSRNAKPLLAGADWDNSRHDRVMDDEGNDYGGGGGWKSNPEGKARFDVKAKDVNGVELITVPALGPEYVPPPQSSS